MFVNTERGQECEYTTEYTTIEKQTAVSDYNRRLIDGVITSCSSCVGYCKYEQHSGFLNEKQRKEHNCLEKGCFYYVSKPKKEKTGALAKWDDKLVVKQANNAAAEFEGIKFISAVQKPENKYILKYVAISNCYPIAAIEKRISKILGGAVKIMRIECDFNKAAEVIFA